MAASFSYQIKEELCQLMTDEDRQYACLYGMLCFAQTCGAERVALQTEHEKVAALFCRLADHVLKRKDAVCRHETLKRDGGHVYVLSVESAGDREALLKKYRETDREIRQIRMENVDNNGLAMFIAGAFLACGSITDPNKEYHMEFAAGSRQMAENLQEVLLLVGARGKLAARRGLTVLYLKESENVEDILTFMGATKATLEIMNVKILKDVRNRANRLTNCDAANIEKTVNASSRQIEDIRLIAARMGLENLPADLREAAEVRLEYPEYSLRELGETLEKPVSRSGINHRLRRLAEIAGRLRGNPE